MNATTALVCHSVDEPMSTEWPAFVGKHGRR